MAQLISMTGKLDKNGDGQFYIQKTNDGITQEYPLTSWSGTGNGCAQMMSGIMIKWGSFTITESPYKVLFPMAFMKSCYSITLTTENSVSPEAHTGIMAGTVTPSGFSAENQHTPRLVYYIAIGI